MRFAKGQDAVGWAGASAGGQQHRARHAQTAFSAAEAAQAAGTVTHRSVSLSFFHTHLRNFCLRLAAGR